MHEQHGKHKSVIGLSCNVESASVCDGAAAVEASLSWPYGWLTYEYIADAYAPHKVQALHKVEHSNGLMIPSSRQHRLHLAILPKYVPPSAAEQ